jgi:hypothetical protein
VATADGDFRAQLYQLQCQSSAEAQNYRRIMQMQRIVGAHRVAGPPRTDTALPKTANALLTV